MTAYLNQAPQQVSITIASGSTSNTASINLVGANAFIIWQGTNTNQAAASGVSNSIYGYLQLTSTTQVTATRSGSNTDTLTIVGVVIDPTSNLVTGVQQGTIALNSAASNTALISSVSTSLSSVFFLGNSNSNTVAVATQDDCGVTLTNATTVTATTGTAGVTNRTVGYVVVTFAAGAINSIQQFANATTTNAATTNQTINPVVTANTFIAYGGLSTIANVYANCYGYLQLTSTTNVSYTVSTASTDSRTPYFTVIELKSSILKSIQRGTVTLNSVTSNTAAISLVDSTRAFVNLNFYNSNNAIRDRQLPDITLTSGTVVKASRSAAGTGTNVLGYEVLEFAINLSASGAITENKDTIANVSKETFSVSGAITEHKDIVVSAANAPIAHGSITENRDTATSTILETFKISATITENKDSVTSSVKENINAVSSITENKDIVNGVEANALHVSGTVRESGDRVSNLTFVIRNAVKLTGYIAKPTLTGYAINSATMTGSEQ